MPSLTVNQGILILLAPDSTEANITTKNLYFVFQYNPDKLIHTFNSMPSASTVVPGLPMEQQGPPTEYFNLTFDLDGVELDSLDQNVSQSGLGLHPALAVLELMMQPQVIGNHTVQPIVVFCWGIKRIVAVRLLSMNVDETAFDVTLNPTRATINLTMRVLEEAEIKSNAAAHGVCLNHQRTRMALVDAYKLRTGQGSLKTAEGFSGSQSAVVQSVAGISGGSAARRKKTAINRA